MRLALAILAYFAIVFATGFVMGPIRILGLEPMLGKTAAVLVEMPVLLMAMLFAARFVPRRFRISAVRELWLIGLGALALVLLADTLVGLFLRQQSFSAILLNFTTPAGMVYAASLLLFAAMPRLARRAS